MSQISRTRASKEELKKMMVRYFREDSYTVEEVCKNVGVSSTSYYRWMEEDPEFREAIKKARELLGEVMLVVAKRGLMKSIGGYEITETKENQLVEIKENGGEEITVVKRTVFKRYIEPNTSAIIFTLCNLDPEHWKRYDKDSEVEEKLNTFMLKYRVNSDEKGSKDKQSNSAS